MQFVRRKLYPVKSNNKYMKVLTNQKLYDFLNPLHVKSFIWL